MPRRRWYADLLLVWTCGLALVSGCTSAPFGKWMPGREREPVISRKSQALKEKFPSESSEEAIKSKSKQPPSDRPPAIADRSAVKPSALDPAMQSLIHSELKDLPAEERKRWKEHLSSVKPAEIPHILQARTRGIIPWEVAESAKAAEEETANREVAEQEPTSRKVVQPLTEMDSSPLDVQQASGSDEEETPPVIQIGLDRSNPSETQSAGDDAERDPSQPSDGSSIPATEEKHGFDAIKIWPQGKRGERSFTDRLSAGRLTPPWSRDSHPPSDEKQLKGKAKLAIPPEKPVATALVEKSVSRDPQADYWQDELHKLISLMEAEAARPPADESPAERQAHIQRQVYLRMLYLMAAEPEKAQLPISDVEAVDQEFWSSMFWGMSNYFDDEQTGDPGTRAAQTIAQLNAAARQLQSVADLELRNVSFCHQIDGWGLYDRFDRDEFEPGQTVLLYGEIRNFSSEATASGMYRTLVSSTIEIVKSGQEETVLERNDLGDTEDQCRGLRSDFYNSYHLDIPAHLTPGSYQLRLTVEDKLSGRFATQTIGFTIR